MKQNLTTAPEPVACEILAYFFNHPDASDTMEGIVEWRLLQERIRHSVTEAEAALSQLVTSKLILARRGTDGRVHYSMNPAKKAEIEKLLKLNSPLRNPGRRKPGQET